MADDYVERAVDPVLVELMAEMPAIMLTGPRATGKTTTAKRHAATVIRLDQPREAAAFEADPDSALASFPEPVLLDEWQAVPGVLGAVKRAVDDDPRPGRFVLTGSVRADLSAETWPGTGRVIRLSMQGMTVAELRGAVDVRFIDELTRSEGETPVAENCPDLRGYVETALRSGYPEAALRLSAAGRRRWLGSYVEQLVTRDAERLESGRDPDRLRGYFEALALNTAGVVEHNTLYESAGINRRTAVAYDQLLKNLLVLDDVPPWASNRLKRLARKPKRYMTDVGLVVGALGIDVNAVMRDGNLLGRTLDTFVASQLRAQLALSPTPSRLFHLRADQGRRELDLLVEIGARHVIGIEVKASASPTRDDGRHLVWLRDQLGDRFLRGVVLHTGPRRYRLDERVDAIPMCALWSIGRR